MTNPPTTSAVTPKIVLHGAVITALEDKEIEPQKQGDPAVKYREISLVCGLQFFVGTAAKDLKIETLRPCDLTVELKAAGTRPPTVRVKITDIAYL